MNLCEFKAWSTRASSRTGSNATRETLSRKTKKRKKEKEYTMHNSCSLYGQTETENYLLRSSDSRILGVRKINVMVLEQEKFIYPGRWRKRED